MRKITRSIWNPFDSAPPRDAAIAFDRALAHGAARAGAPRDKGRDSGVIVGVFVTAVEQILA